MLELKLVPISGGVDSTYLLYNYLKNTNYTVHAHHIILKSRFEPRWEQELKACRSIVNYCKDIRMFNYTESIWEFPFHCWDFEVVAFCAGQIATKIKDFKTKISLVAGRIKEDDTRQSSSDRLEFMQQIWRASSASVQNFVYPVFEMPLRNLSKYDVMNKMPKELLDMCWTCRRPEDDQPCNKCHSCEVFNSAKSKLDHDVVVI